jgi:hypothetical protein
VTETMTDMDVSAPSAATPDAKLLARRPGRELFPASWLRRGVRVEYELGGEAQNTRGMLLDFCGVGILIGANGTRLLLTWECVRTIELQND